MGKTINYIDPLDTHQVKESTIQVGDLVVIDKSFYNSLHSHRDSDDQIPAHNHGTVTSVIKPRDRDAKGRHLHPAPYTAPLNIYDYITFTLPNQQSLSLFSKSLRKLY